MLTTTPFLSPREGCEPMPSTSIEPSAPTSPTRATTLDVPMSRPMMRLLSERLGIADLVLVDGSARSFATPADGESVRVTHIDIGNVRRALRHDLQGGSDE